MIEPEQKIVELPIERPAIRPEEDPAGHIHCIVAMLGGPEGEAA